MLAEEINNKDTEKPYSGINIEEAKQMLRAEDQFDKKIYRERIKRVHKVSWNHYLENFFKLFQEYNNIIGKET